MSVQKHGSGWRYRVSYVDATGARHWVTRGGFSSKRDAQRAEAQAKVRLDASRSVVTGRTTVGDYLGAWFDTYERSQSRKPTTVDATRLHLDRYLLPRIGQLPLHDLTPAVISDLYADLLANGRTGRNGTGGLSPKTVRNIAGTLHKALADGVRRETIPRNPADAVDLPKVRRVEPRAWDADQVHTFLAHLAATRPVGDPDATVWRLTLATGMRRGEVLGLRWDRVDLVGCTLTVDNNRVVTRAGMVEGTPKSDAGLRRISLDHGTRDALAQLRDAQEKAAEIIGCSPFPYVATQLDGVQIHPRAFLRRLNKAQDEAGLPRVNLHELRHTNITAALQAGTAVHVVSRRVGHSKVSTTLDTYARHIPSADDLAAETMGRLLEGPSWSPNGHQSAEMVTR